MACAAHCLGAAMATVSSRLPHLAPCANAPRCHGLVCGGQAVLPLLQPAASLPAAFGSVWKPRGGASLTSGRPASQRMIVMASQDAGTSTLVVQEVEFVWKGPGSKVLLSGDFLNWESQLTLEKTGSDDWFVVKQKLAPGTYKYKYIVDGEWKHSPDYPSVSDDAGGFNNEITVAENKSSTPLTNKEGNGEATVKPPPAPKEAEAKTSAKPSAAASPPKPKVAAAGGAKKVAKAVAKPLPEMMVEEIIPKLIAYFENEKGISDVEIKFDDNQLQGSFIKNLVPYNFWAYFPDGKLEGSRGFSLTSHGSSPSTVEPFLIDENKLSADLVVQQVIKRLFAQKLLATN